MSRHQNKAGKTRAVKVMENLQSALHTHLEAFLDTRQQKAESLLKLVDVLTHLRQADDLEILLDEATQTAIELAGVSGAAISVTETHGSDDLTLYRHQNMEPGEPDDLIFDAKSPLLTAARDAGGPLLVADLVGKTGPRSRKRAVLRRLGCEMVVPFICRGRVLGLLLLSRRADGLSPADEEIEVLAAYAALLSLATENILLHRRYQQEQ